MGQEALAETRPYSQLQKYKTHSRAPPTPHPQTPRGVRSTHQAKLPPSCGGTRHSQSPPYGSPSLSRSERDLLEQPLLLLVPGTRALTNQLPCSLQENANFPTIRCSSWQGKVSLSHPNQWETEPVTKFAHWDCRARNAISHVGNGEPSWAEPSKAPANNERLLRAFKPT